MLVPANMTEADFVKRVNGVIALVAPSFVFSYYDFDDISQHCWVEVLKALPKYDGVRPIENFVFTHIRNRLINLWRDELRRNEPPCDDCFSCYSNSILPAHCNRSCASDGDYCKKFRAWLRRNNAKASLAEPGDISCVSEDTFAQQRYSPALFRLEYEELRAKIDAELPAELRSVYQRMLVDEKVATRKRAEVVAAIKKIIGGTGHLT